MRFRYLLPATELIILGILVSIPLHRCLPLYRLRNADGTERIDIEGPPSTSCMGHVPQLAQDVNLPAAIIVSPLLLAKYDYRNDGHDWIHDPIWISLGYTLSGTVVWFFVGRFLDDFIAHRKMRIWSRVHISDLVFAAISFVMASLAVIAALGPSELGGLVFVFSASIWLLIGGSNATFRAIQIAKNRRRIPAP